MARSKGSVAKQREAEGEAEERVQFSITMPQGQRFKIETMAGLHHMSISDYINMVLNAHLDTIPQATWDQIRELEKHVRSKGIQFTQSK